MTKVQLPLKGCCYSAWLVRGDSCKLYKPCLWGYALCCWSGYCIPRPRWSFSLSLQLVVGYRYGWLETYQGFPSCSNMCLRFLIRRKSEVCRKSIHAGAHTTWQHRLQLCNFTAPSTGPTVVVALTIPIKVPLARSVPGNGASDHVSDECRLISSRQEYGSLYYLLLKHGR